MAKLTKPAAKKVNKPVIEAPASEKKTRNRPTVLVKKTAKQLIEMLGSEDIAIGVSRKELVAILNKKTAAKISAALDEE